MHFREPRGGDWTKTAVLLIVFVAALIVAAYLLPQLLFPLGFALWLAIVAAAVLALLSWHARNFGYRCSRCGHEFGVSALTELLTPHVGRRHYVRCPNCGRRSWALILVKEDEVRGRKGPDGHA